MDFMLTSDVSEEELEHDDVEAMEYTYRYKKIYKKCQALVKPKVAASSSTTSEVSFASSSHHRIKTAQDLGLSPIGQESLKHVVFGGHTSESVHQEYRVNLGHASGNFKMVAKLLDQQKICGSLPRLSRGPWLKELKARRIWVPDIGKDDMEIEILLGCDVLGSIFMMKSCVLSNGLTASQTRFGWTLMGECQPGSDVSLARHVTTMTISESSITNLWNLDVLGIMDPIEVKQRDQRDALARRHFIKTVQHSVSGRYVVSLPWTVEKAKIADNREVAMKRLEQTTKKLISLNLYEDYDDIFRGWLDDGIIEKVPAEQHDAEAFYLPHRPVVKLSSGTTPIRPVFDASSKRLQKSFYVDNLVTSVNSFEELQDLKLTATSIMDNARLELSRWEHSLDVASDTYPFERAEISKVLGVCWDKREDCLSCEIPVAIPPKITKRSILSCLAQIYDPIGFLSPILIKPKILLQKAWTLKLAWDDELDRHYKDELSLWFDDLQLHKGMAIPRNFNPLMVPQKDWQIHTFVDASSEAYAAVVFLRTRVGDKVEVHMMAAKSRVAPLKRPTIPRLELLACVVGARLNKMIFEALELKDIKNVFWSDATTALAWIKRDDQWGTFVGNRVKEICRLSDPGNWRYVPSECNPADLPSRGCSLSRLIQSRWWEGPSWLKLSEEFWPSSYKDLNEEEICAERKKIAVVTTVKSTDHWYMKYFSSFIKNVRMMAWIRRFINNLRSSTKVKGELSVKEIDEAELALLKLVQAECFPSHSIPGLKVCEVEGILRVKTKLIYSSDEYGFRLPVLLHGTHPLIEQMICDSHVENCHAGVQFLMNKLREKYWIVKARQTIKKIVRRCVTCRRFSAKPVVVEDAPLPATRVHNAKVFEVAGIDLAGPLYLKDQTKTWVVLFTCAVYRCVHLELVISLSTEDFLMALERFIKRRGRPSTIFSDNGTNFVGANNFFKKIDWERVSNDGKVKRIEWKFIPPTAAWWGGWWERLIRSLKDILKRMLGTSTLTYQQLMTLLCHAEAVMNGRPMTYVSDDPNDLVTISPSMFLQEQTDVEFPECQNMGSNPTTQKLRHLNKLREELKSRFRKEYLSLLVQRNRRIDNPKLQAGDVVLVGMDNQKRNFWPLAVIEEILFGRDGVNRLVKVKTAVGTFLRPIQKIYPLEISSTAASSRLLNDKEKTAKIQTRSGRTICKPNRLDDYLCFSVCLDKNSNNFGLIPDFGPSFTGLELEIAAREILEMVHRFLPFFLMLLIAEGPAQVLVCQRPTERRRQPIAQEPEGRVDIIQDKEGISLQQSHYVQQILQKYGMENCKEVPTPGSKEINLDNHIEDDNCDQHTYQEALGMLMFLAVNTRPDIAYITSKLSQYSRQPKQMHWTIIKRVMRYLRGTIDLGVKFERGKTGILKSYTDASWSTTHDGKSYRGYVLKLGEATIDWKSSKQPLVALSTMEAEMIVACESCCQIKWIINLLRELEEWNFMEKDSQSLINWISSPKQSSRCRHISRKYHFLRDCYESRDICLLYKPSQDLEADIFTKDLSRDQMKKHLENFSIVGIKTK
ncbi:hypothetical protein LAZ67_21001675 [Cordylochernes scorpioides]|uniref:Integrase catalytic domain-containing protein n=1 Tax=Cordylochernes scorpioides TaxID=51811 RepID=A0ABY6LQ76_9ARAC|nr:hypothetical protein LAZ67_21001675 [Cordylochernes scorpioides]